MPSQTWDLRDEDLQRYVVDVEYGSFSGRRVIRLNGREVARAKNMLEGGTEQRFHFDGHDFVVRMRFEGAELLVDGQPVLATGTVVPRPPRSTQGSGIGAVGTTERGAADAGEPPHRGSARTDMEPALPAERHTRHGALVERRDNGARWFYWIAGLTLINAALFAVQMDWGFAVGTLISFFLEAMLYEIVGEPLSWAAHLAVAALYLVLGWRALRGNEWAFIVGGAIYLIDTGVVIWAQDWLGLMVHAFALYALLTGWLAQRKLRSVPEISAPAPITR